MHQTADVRESLQRANQYVSTGVEQILNGHVKESYRVSISPGASALATLALLAIGRGFEVTHKRGAQWL